MKTKTTIILLIIAIIIAGYIFFIDKNLPTSDEREAAGKKIFGLLKSEDIGHIEINAPNASQMTIVGAMTPTTPTRIAIICTKTKDNEWLMTQPVSTRADKSVLNDIAGKIAELEKKDTIKETGKAPAYGLDYPTITISFTAKDKNHLIKLGQPAPLDIGVYMAIDGRDEFYIVHKSFADMINKPVADFRHKKVFDTGADDLTSLKFIYPDKTIELQKSGTEWQITQPVADKADQNKVRDILAQMGTLNVSAFVADNETNLANYGLDKPDLKVIALDPKDPKKSEILLVGKELEKGKYIAAKEGGQTIFTIDKGYYDTLAAPLDALRNKKAFELKASDVNRIEVKYKNNTAFSLDKNTPDKKWQFVYPTMTVTNQAPSDVESFLDKLNNSLIEQFAADTTTDLSAFGLAEPFTGLEITLGFASGAKEDRVLMGIVKNKPYIYLKRPDSPKVVAIGNSLFDHLKQGNTLFRKKSLMNVASDKVRKISISTNDGITAFEQPKPLEWRQVLPQTKPTDKTTDLNTLMLEFCHMSASEFVVDLNFSPDLAAFGLDQPEAIVNMDWSEKNNEFIGKTIHIGKKVDDHYYARFADDVIIFKVASSFVDAARKLIETKPVVEPPK